MSRRPPSGDHPPARNGHGSERRRRLLLWTSGSLGAVLMVALLTLFAFSSRLASLLPHATWFVVLFVILGVGCLFLFQWIAKRYHL